MSNNISQNDEQNNDEQMIDEGNRGASRKLKISTVLAIAAIVVIVGGSAYGLANGTIFQHRDETAAECGGGSCSDCEDAGPAAYFGGSAPEQSSAAPSQLETPNTSVVESKTATESAGVGACADCDE